MSFPKPTDSEWLILQVLWEKDQASVREVNQILAERRGEEIGYTTTLKLMQIMYEKGLAERDESNRTFLYRASVPEALMQKALLVRFIDSVFRGSASDVVIQTINSSRATSSEVSKIKTFLESKQLL